MATNKLFFALIPQNGTLSTRIFESESVLNEVKSAHPDKIKENNCGWVNASEVDMNRYQPISSLEQFNQQPTDQGTQNQETVSQSSQGVTA